VVRLKAGDTPGFGPKARRYDGDPVQLAVVGSRSFLRTAQITAGLVVLNIVTGAAVRLTDSGLGCPDWPTCARHHLTPPLSLHPVVEFGNRLVVVVLCVATVVTLVAALSRVPRRRDLVWLSAGLVAGVVGEALLGAVVVYTKLNPYAVMTHFMVGIALLTDVVVLGLRAGRESLGAPAIAKVGLGDLRTGRLMVGLLALVLVAGTATTGAGPHAGGKGAQRLPVPLSDMARVHSGLVLVLVATCLVLLYRLERSAAPVSVLVRGRVLLGTMVAQGAIGYAQYFSHLPALLVGVHVFGATAVWSAMLWFYDGLWHRAPVVAPPVLGPRSVLHATPTAVPAGDDGAAEATHDDTDDMARRGLS
jgi:heme a synthase